MESNQQTLAARRQSDVDYRDAMDMRSGARGAIVGQAIRQPEITRLTMTMAEELKNLDDAAGSFIDRVRTTMGPDGAGSTGDVLAQKTREAPATELGALLDQQIHQIRGITARLRDARSRVEL